MRIRITQSTKELQRSHNDSWFGGSRAFYIGCSMWAMIFAPFQAALLSSKVYPSLYSVILTDTSSHSSISSFTTSDRQPALPDLQRTLPCLQWRWHPQPATKRLSQQQRSRSMTQHLKWSVRSGRFDLPPRSLCCCSMLPRKRFR
jgi:hypothetical protein